MAEKSLEELPADWIATGGTAVIQATLNSETDEFRYKILTALLAKEFENFKGYPLF
jgi:hypothetical protein